MKRPLAIIGALLLAACGAAETPRPDFREALDAHLAAIEAKDIYAYIPTVTSAEDLHLIFPDGSAIETTEGVVDFHREWFEDADWRMEPEVVKLMEGEDLAAALLKYDYRDTPEGAPRGAWLILVFELEDGEWRLIHDQNTRITQETNREAE